MLIENSTGNVKMLARFVADIPDDKMCVQFPNLPNHAAWTLGHLTQSRINISNMIGKPAELPAPDWSARFGRGSAPVSDPAAYPAKGEMLVILQKTHDHLIGALATIDPALLNVPHDRAFFLPLFPTKAHLVATVLTTHDGIHIGQLADFRRALGLPTVI